MYGVGTGLLRLWKVDQVALTAWDLCGTALSLTGMAIIVWGGWRVS
jgi:drug/metabolite transporter superfamily protein YnfA